METRLDWNWSRVNASGNDSLLEELEEADMTEVVVTV